MPPIEWRLDELDEAIRLRLRGAGSAEVYIILLTSRVQRCTSEIEQLKARIKELEAK